MNRGLARRSVFEDRACVRHFLSCLARTVRLGLLELHAYCLLTNHFHLLVRSPTGRLAEAMRLAQNRYVRWFNRRSRRDGPLFRGRFRSRPVESLEYRRQLLIYIDDNPVAAGLVRIPELYPHGSAARHVEARGPRWLERGWVEDEARSITGDQTYGPETYRKAFGLSPTRFERELIEARLASGARGPDPLDDLLAAGPERVLRWLQRGRRNAEGAGAGLPCASTGRILQVIEERAALDRGWCLVRGTRRPVAWAPMRVGLLRDLGGVSWKEAQERTGLGASAVRRAYETHRVWLQQDGGYGRVVGEVASSSVSTVRR